MAAKSETGARRYLNESPDDFVLLGALSDAYFYFGEANEARGRIEEARVNYASSRDIAKRLAKHADVALTSTRLAELEGK